MLGAFVGRGFFGRPGKLGSGFPEHKTEEGVDSLFIADGKYITFQLWSFNTRAMSFTDFIYLLKEKDEDAVKLGGRKGAKSHKYIEVNYMPILPVTEFGRIGGDFSPADEIIFEIRKSLLNLGAKEIPCQ